MPVQQEWLEERKVNDQTFYFLGVDSPEKWEAASDIDATFPMTIPGTGKRIDIPMKGISYTNFLAITQKYPSPEYQGEGEEPKEFKAAREKARTERKIAILELATGWTIPGANYSDKNEWLKQQNPGNMESIDLFIGRELMNTETYTGPMLASYNTMRQIFPEETVVSVNSFQELMAETSEVIHYFRLNRHNQNYIVEIPLKSLSREKKIDIEAKTPEPTPPSIPMFHPLTKQPIPGKMIQNTSDPGYLRAVNKVRQQSTLMYLNACLPFKIPGETEEDQIRWIGDRLVGDMIQINNYINYTILGMEGRYDFFISG